MSTEYKKLDLQDTQAIMRLQHLTPSRNWSEDETAKLLKNNWARAFGVWENETLIGICILKVIANEAEILELAMDHHHRQAGHAQRLWQHVKKNFPSASFFLEVSDKNTPAINFYKKMGFKQIHVRPNYYAPNENGLVYEL